MVDKVIRKINAGEEYDILAPKDHSRGAIILKSWEDAPAVIDRLGQLGFSGEETIFSPLNHFGYRGINLNTKFPNGLSGEIQIHTPESWKLKIEKSDPIYMKWRGILESELSPEQLKKRDKDVEKSYKLWENYWRTIPLDIRSSISKSAKSLSQKKFSTIT